MLQDTLRSCTVLGRESMLTCSNGKVCVGGFKYYVFETIN